MAGIDIINVVKPLFTKQELEKTKSKEKLPCVCYYCNSTFYTLKHNIVKVLNHTNTNNCVKYCSRKCGFESRKTGVKINCSYCNRLVYVLNNTFKKSSNKRFFCNHSCAAHHQNSNKIKGVRVSKFEIFVQNLLRSTYPNFKFHFNENNIINSELDIYVPHLKLAFEINGIFHYKPIFGENKLFKIQQSDLKKSISCQEKNIHLYVINVSHYKQTTKIALNEVGNSILSIISNHLAV